MTIKGERYIVFLMKVYVPSGLSKVEEKQQFQIDDCQEGFTRSRKMTMKGLLHKKNTLRERRRKINSRLIRKYGTIEDFLYSSTNKVAVEKAMNQFNDLLKMLIDIHQDYNQLLDDDEREKNDD